MEIFRFYGIQKKNTKVKKKDLCTFPIHILNPSEIFCISRYKKKSEKNATPFNVKKFIFHNSNSEMLLINLNEN